MEDIKGYIELVIAATYSAHTFIAYREAVEEQDPDKGPARRRHLPRFSAETFCLLAVALSYYMMASITVFAGH